MNYWALIEGARDYITSGGRRAGSNKFKEGIVGVKKEKEGNGKSHEK
jgi:hypothetical protein